MIDPAQCDHLLTPVEYDPATGMYNTTCADCGEWLWQASKPSDYIMGILPDFLD